jgi:hypothetical protein
MVQLMELAGLACAQAFHKTFPPTSHPKVMICCGPGNQGGDGLVAARHLHHFKYKPTIYLPKPGSKDIYKRLLRQCENLKIPVISETGKFEEGLKESDAILDAVFGMSSNPWIILILRVLICSADTEAVRFGFEGYEGLWSTDPISRHPLRMACRGWTSGEFPECLHLNTLINSLYILRKMTRGRARLLRLSPRKH